MSACERRCKAVVLYHHAEMGKSYCRISIITAQEIVEGHKMLEIPMSIEVLKAAEREFRDEQMKLL